MAAEKVAVSQAQVTILATKLRPPRPRPGLVPRQHLVRRLVEGLALPVILVAAPAGFGKTTLVSAWLAQTPGLPAAWLSLDDDDNDPARFLSYVISALDSLKPGIGAPALALLALPQVPPWKTILMTLLNSLAALRGDFVLVLDDYHLLTEATIHAALTYLLDHMPGNMHVIILSRADPPLPLARLRARGQLLELRQADLRFSAQEAGAFLGQTMKLTLASDEVAALQRQTEGWIVGLQMAALCMAAPGPSGPAQPAAFIAAFSGSNRFILDYLMEEVLARQPAHIQRFLLYTAVLDQLSAPLCAAVLAGYLDTPPAQAILEDLERANLFTIPLDHERRWYRYHHLFADFLRGRLLGTEPDRPPELHRRAAAWYEQHGLVQEAVGHTLDGADWERAARLIEGTVQNLLMRGQVATVTGWLELLPEDVLHQHPRLSVFYAWALLITGQYAEVERHLAASEAAATRPEAEPAAQGSLAAQVSAARLMLALYTGADMARPLELALRMLHNLPQDDALSRGIAALIAGLASMVRGDLTTAHEAFAESLEVSRAAGGNPLIAQMAVYAAGYEELIRGHLRRAEEIFNHGLRLLETTAGAEPPPIACLVYQALGEVLRERDDLDAAEGYLVRATDLGERLRSPDILADGIFTLARLRQARGDIPGAMAVIGRALQHAAEGKLMTFTARQAQAHQARLQIAQGDLQGAERWATGLAEARQATRPWGWVGVITAIIDSMEDTVLARLRLAQHRYAEAAAVLRLVLETSSDWASVMIEALAMLALALEGQDEHSQASAVMKASLDLAEPEGYARIYLDEGAAMNALLRRMRAEASQVGLSAAVVAYADRLLAAFARPAASPAPSRATDSSPAVSSSSDTIVEPLSAREHEVLALVAAGLSTGEVAVRLVVTEGTVKRHVHNILEKLGAHSRTQAVARARELHIL